MSERDVLFPVLCGFGPKRHLHFAHYGIGQHILHLCGGSIADLVVKAAGAAAVDRQATILHKYLEQPGVPLFPRFGFIP